MVIEKYPHVKSVTSVVSEGLSTSGGQIDSNIDNIDTNVMRSTLTFQFLSIH